MDELVHVGGIGSQLSGIAQMGAAGDRSPAEREVRVAGVAVGAGHRCGEGCQQPDQA